MNAAPPPPVVLGAGIAGIAAAAALRQVYPQVLIVERDALPASPAPRRGVPQGNQLHNILGRAQQHLEALLPGFTDALLAAGGSTASVADGTHVFEFGQVMPQVPLGMQLLCAPRPVIEHVARGLLTRHEGVEILEGVRVCGLRSSNEGVTAIEVEDVGGQREFPAHLVVDATGASSSSPEWMAEGDVHLPREDLQPGQWYATTEFATPFPEGGKRFFLSFPTATCTMGALASPIGANRLHVSVSGRRHDQVPRSVEDVRRILGQLPDPTIARVVSDARASTNPTVFKKNTATWWRFDKIANPIAGLLPIGDAIASLNPLLGQGMSVAAWEAALLGSALRKLGGAGADRDQLTRAYLTSTRLPVGSAWRIAEQVDEALGEQIQDDYGWLVEKLVRDQDAHRLYVRVWHLLEPASRLRELVPTASSATIPSG